MSDMFFIIASVCIVIITILLSLLLLRLIKTADEVDGIVVQTQETASKVSSAITTAASVGAVVSPILGITKMLFGRRKKK
jgi:uncharacterized oligopeptide transporter (OPT) family protein